jgi:hypothetical protein
VVGRRIVSADRRRWATKSTGLAGPRLDLAAVADAPTNHACPRCRCPLASLAEHRQAHGQRRERLSRGTGVIRGERQPVLLDERHAIDRARARLVARRDRHAGPERRRQRVLGLQQLDLRDLAVAVAVHLRDQLRRLAAGQHDVDVDPPPVDAVASPCDSPGVCAAAGRDRPAQTTNTTIGEARTDHAYRARPAAVKRSPASRRQERRDLGLAGHRVAVAELEQAVDVTWLEGQVAEQVPAARPGRADAAQQVAQRPREAVVLVAGEPAEVLRRAQRQRGRAGAAAPACARGQRSARTSPPG